MNFPIEDVIRNARHFLTTVKKATGNLADKDVRQSKGGPKPGLYTYTESEYYVIYPRIFSELYYSRGLKFHTGTGHSDIRYLTRDGDY